MASVLDGTNPDPKAPLAEAEGPALKPIAATASSANGGNTAAKSIDGSVGSRWESSQSDDNWIQFDFGKPTAIGYLKLTRENSYGQEYALEASDDAATWYQLRYVTDGKGKTEEFFNLNSQACCVRLKGVKRGTRYGHSLYEAEFKSPGSGDTLGGTLATSAVPFPPSGAGLAAEGAEKPPLEVLQFKLADGTLVTRWGVRAGGRHGRERGEAWNEIGYRNNETVDAAGAPVDKGPSSLVPAPR